MTGEEKKELLRWALADQAFAEADALAAHMIEINPIHGSELFAAFCTGIATSYFRPFVGSNGLGTLPQDFKDLMKFDELGKHAKNLTKVHKMLRDTRAKFGGHFDLIYAEQMHQIGELETSPGSMQIEFGADGVKTSVNLIHMDIKAVKFARTLFKVQRARTGEKIGAIGQELYRAHDFVPGDLIIEINGDLSATQRPSETGPAKI